MSKTKILTYIVIALLFIPVFFLQSAFQKINPYDPNWIYGDDIVKVNKEFYQRTKDKNLYFTYLFYNWAIKFTKANADNIEKYLLRKETIDFITDMIELGDNSSFSRLYKNMSAVILFNLDLTPGLRMEYANQIFEKLQTQKSKEKQSEDTKIYKQYFEKEFNYCSKYNLPLNEIYNELYWGLGVSDRLYNKKLERAFCNYLYSGFKTNKSAYAEQMMYLSTQIENEIFGQNYIDDFGTRLKEYYYHEVSLKEENTKKNGDIYIKDNGALLKKIRDVNNAMRNSNNGYHINKIINEQ